MLKTAIHRATTARTRQLLPSSLLHASASQMTESFYNFKVNDLQGKPFDLPAASKGKIVIVVNVASKCGFTGQYAGLEKLYQDYKDKGLVILGFPCNQFGGQEPGSAEDIATFCSRTYNVSFPIMEKVEVNGDAAAPIYQWLKSQKKQLMMERIKWNFEKFLIDCRQEPPVVVNRYASTTTPESIAKDVAKLLSS